MTLQLKPPPRWGVVLTFCDDLKRGLVEIGTEMAAFSADQFKPGPIFRRPRDREVVYVQFNEHNALESVIPKDSMPPSMHPKIPSWWQRLGGRDMNQSVSKNTPTTSIWFQSLDSRERKHLLCALHRFRTGDQISSDVPLIESLLSKLEEEHDFAKYGK